MKGLKEEEMLRKLHLTKRLIATDVPGIPKTSYSHASLMVQNDRGFTKINPTKQSVSQKKIYIYLQYLFYNLQYLQYYCVLCRTI